jgi:hypothetical protein
VIGRVGNGGGVIGGAICGGRCVLGLVGNSGGVIGGVIARGVIGGGANNSGAIVDG